MTHFTPTHLGMLTITKNAIRILLSIAALTGACASHSQEMQLALNPPPHLETLGLNQARAIFSMRVRSWADGSAITVFVLPDSNKDHQLFVRKILTLLPHQLRRNWDRMVYTGIGQAPIEVNSEQEMLMKLQATPGSIGYLSDQIDNKGGERESLIFISLQ